MYVLVKWAPITASGLVRPRSGLAWPVRAWRYVVPDSPRLRTIKTFIPRRFFNSPLTFPSTALRSVLRSGICASLLPTIADRWTPSPCFEDSPSNAIESLALHPSPTPLLTRPVEGQTWASTEAMLGDVWIGGRTATSFGWAKIRRCCASCEASSGANHDNGVTGGCGRIEWTPSGGREMTGWCEKASTRYAGLSLQVSAAAVDVLHGCRSLWRMQSRSNCRGRRDTRRDWLVEIRGVRGARGLTIDD